MGSVSVSSEAEWLSIREANIGGSDVASLFYRWRYPDGTEAVHHLFDRPPEGSQILECLSSFKTGYRLWQEKAGRLQPENLDNVERVQAGVFLEPALTAWANKKWEWKLRNVHRYLTHPIIKGWGASLDCEVHEPGMPPVEFKNVDGWIFRDEWVVMEGEILMPPLKYELQLQHQIGAAKADHGWVVACVGGNQLMRGRIDRHEGTQEKIANAVSAFWASIANNVEPVWLADYEAVAEVYSHGSADLATDLTGDEELSVLCNSYLTQKKELGELEMIVDNIKAQIGARIGEATKVKAAGFRLGWPVIDRPEKEIPARIQKALVYRGALNVRPNKEESGV
ncbi:hypothetical protein UFOVP119_20 [uncultured Caudovirales phage]|uniref:YqaJ viral recombinase domain-containing protein n=1 Tax=uncultured Caudovirales phage TaxID=2100421 RepID=A0A6J5LAX3_9CAUD|nr:hypothetical protein UFOVP119_20 [uncultured Caudovirales phage]